MRNLLIFATILTACNTAPDKNRQEANVIESAKQIIPVAPPPGNPNIDDQLNAQDTLFDDGSIPSSWANAGFDDPAGFKRFLLSFKDWVRDDKVDSITAHVRFPLKNYKTPTAFKQAYPQIFDVNLKTAVDTQRVDRIFRNQQGAMLGDGQIWFSVVDGKYKIIAINK